MKLDPLPRLEPFAEPIPTHNILLSKLADEIYIAFLLEGKIYIIRGEVHHYPDDIVVIWTTSSMEPTLKKGSSR